MNIIVLGQKSNYTNPEDEAIFRKINFFSNDSILDASILIWDVKGSLQEVSEYEIYRDKVIGDVALKTLKRQFISRKEELNEYILLGRSLFVELYYTFTVHTKGYVGESVSNETFDFWDILPFKKPILLNKQGVNIDYIKPFNKLDYLKNSLPLIKYYATIDKTEGEPFLRISGTQHIVGQFIRRKRGFFSCLDFNGLLLINMKPLSSHITISLSLLSWPYTLGSKLKKGCDSKLRGQSIDLFSRLKASSRLFRVFPAKRQCYPYRLG